MNKEKIGTYLNLAKHIGIFMAFTLVMLILFFYVFLPINTHHGETLTVPDLTGIVLDDLDEFLVKRDLRYEVSDSAFSKDYPPLTVLSQFPESGAKVKKDRKIYISVNSFQPPMTTMPELIDRSLRNAELELSSYELSRGKILFKPSPFENAVLDVRYKGETIEPGTKIPKGTKIDLVVGDGYGNRRFEIPSFLGKPLDEVKVSVLGMNLRIGVILNQGDSSEAPGIIYKQIPEEGEVVKIGDVVDLWVTPNDSTYIELITPGESTDQ